MYPGGRGYSSISYMGMCHPNGLFFHEKSLNMGPLFRGKTLRHAGPFFQNVQNFGCLPSKISKIFRCSHENRPTFREKFLEMGTFFGNNDPQKGFQGSGGTSQSLGKSELLYYFIRLTIYIMYILHNAYSVHINTKLKLPAARDKQMCSVCYDEMNSDIVLLVIDSYFHHGPQRPCFHQCKKWYLSW